MGGAVQQRLGPLRSAIPSTAFAHTVWHLRGLRLPHSGLCHCPRGPRDFVLWDRFAWCSAINWVVITILFSFLDRSLLTGVSTLISGIAWIFMRILIFPVLFIANIAQNYTGNQAMFEAEKGHMPDFPGIYIAKAFADSYGTSSRRSLRL